MYLETGNLRLSHAWFKIYGGKNACHSRDVQRALGTPRLRIRQNRGVSMHWGGVSAVDRDFGYAASLSRCRITLANRAMNSPLVGFPRLALTVLPK